MPVVLITGANRGLGLEFAKQYADRAWTVFATARDVGAAKDLSAIPGVEAFPLDVSDSGEIDTLVEALAGRPIDLLVNNAGVYGPKDGSVTREDWRMVLETNCIAPFFLTRALLPNIESSKGRTVAILTSKMGSMADNTSGGSYIYRSSKAAVNAVFKSFAHDLRSKRIKVVLLHPGWARTDMGGANAPITTETSVRGLGKVIDDLTCEASGRFYAFDGSVVPW